MAVIGNTHVGASRIGLPLVALGACLLMRCGLAALRRPCACSLAQEADLI